MRVDELQKPQWQWCPHCLVGKGCGIYASRPEECRVYLCEYLQNPDVSPAWYPKTSHMIIEVIEDRTKAHVYVDPDHPEVWRSEPFYSDLKDSAREALKFRCRLTVHVGRAQTIIFPDRDVEFGIVEPDEEIIVVFPKKTEAKVRAAAYKRKIGGASLGPEHWR
jgi:hypothetical protein